MALCITPLDLAMQLALCYGLQLLPYTQGQYSCKINGKMDAQLYTQILEEDFKQPWNIMARRWEI